MPSSPGAPDPEGHGRERRDRYQQLRPPHDLWPPEQYEAAERAAARVAEEDLRTVRVSVGDPHGKLPRQDRAGGPVPVGPAQRHRLRLGDLPLRHRGRDRLPDPFVRDGSLGDEQLGGFPDVVLVPDPLTFTTLPWAPRTGWCLGSIYYNDGTPVPFDGRRRAAPPLAC